MIIPKIINYIQNRPYKQWAKTFIQNSATFIKEFIYYFIRSLLCICLLPYALFKDVKSPRSRQPFIYTRSTFDKMIQEPIRALFHKQRTRDFFAYSGDSSRD